MEALREVADVPLLVERGPRADGFLYMTGIVQMADAENKNHRVYPRTIWDKTLSESGGFMQRLRANQVVGMMGHPDDNKTIPSKISHVMTKVWVEDRSLPECVVCKASGPVHSHIMGEARILNTTEGVALQKLQEGGVPIGISSRGRGSVRGGSNGQQVVAEDFDLETFDVVLDPSTHGAWLRPVTEQFLQVCADGLCCSTNEDQLTSYRGLVEMALEHGDQSLHGDAQSLIEAIDERLSTPVGAPLEAVRQATQRLREAVAQRKPLGAQHVNEGDGDGQDKNDDVQPGRERVEEQMLDKSNPEVSKLIEEAKRDERRRLSEALAKNDELGAKLKETDANLTAAKAGLGEALTQKRALAFEVQAMRKGIREGLGAGDGGDAGTDMYDADHTLAEAFAASKVVINRLHASNSGLTEENQELSQRVLIAEDFVTRVRVRERRKAIDEHTTKVLEAVGMPAEARPQARQLLTEGAQTLEDVNRRAALIQGLRPGAAGAAAAAAAGRAGAAGLPAAGRQLTEEKRSQASRTDGDGATGDPVSAQGDDRLTEGAITDLTMERLYEQGGAPRTATGSLHS